MRMEECSVCLATVPAVQRNSTHTWSICAVWTMPIGFLQQWRFSISIRMIWTDSILSRIWNAWLTVYSSCARTSTNVSDATPPYSMPSSREMPSGRITARYSSLQMKKKAIVRALDGPVYTLPRVPQPLLLRLDSLSADEGARYHHSVISIEHVLPQNPDTESQWCRWFPDDEERAQWTHRLANLVLLSRRKNAAASNWDFETKKSRYFQHDRVAPFALTTQVLTESEWTPEVLERRQSELPCQLH